MPIGTAAMPAIRRSGRCSTRPSATTSIIVQINPIERAEVPRTPEEISNRLNEITFNSPLLGGTARRRLRRPPHPLRRAEERGLPARAPAPDRRRRPARRLRRRDQVRRLLALPAGIARPRPRRRQGLARGEFRRDRRRGHARHRPGARCASRRRSRSRARRRRDEAHADGPARGSQARPNSLPARRKACREFPVLLSSFRENRFEKPNDSSRFQQNSLRGRAGKFFGRAGNYKFPARAESRDIVAPDARRPEAEFPAGATAVFSKIRRLRRRGHLFLNAAGRFSTKAFMPSFWSSVANSEWKMRRSKRTPSASVVS